MSRLRLLLVLGLFVSAEVLLAQQKKTAMNLKWESFNGGIEHAKSNHKKVLVDVYTEWCGWCKKMDQNVYTDQSVKEYLSKNFVVIKMNAEGDGTVSYKGKEYSPAQLAALFGVTGYPTTLFLKDDSEPITVLPGYLEAPMFLHILSYIAEDQYESKQFDQYLKEKGVTQE